MWFKQFREHIGNFPDGYVLLDIESSGISQSEDLPTQLGYGIVEDRRIKTMVSVVLDWTVHPAIDQRWLRERMEQMNARMIKKGSKPLSYRDLLRYGHHAPSALTHAIEFLSSARKQGLHILTHNGVAYDLPFLANSALRFCNRHLVVNQTKLLDTGIMEKASQLGLLPNPGETTTAFYRRVHRKWSKGAMWSLTNHCIPKYNLEPKMKEHGLTIDNMHDAVSDCVVTHLLFEEMRKLAD